MQNFIIVVGVNSDEDQAGFGVFTEDDFYAHDDDLAKLLWGDGNSPFSTWKEAEVHVRDNNGVIADVYGATVY